MADERHPASPYEPGDESHVTYESEHAETPREHQDSDATQEYAMTDAFRDERDAHAGAHAHGTFEDAAPQGDDPDHRDHEPRSLDDQPVWDDRDDTFYRSEGGATAASVPAGEGDVAPAVAGAGAVPHASSESVRAERERLQAERNARREARLAALAPAPQPDPGLAAQRSEAAGVAPVVTEQVVTERIVTRRSTDRFGPSLGLFLLRLVVAAIMGVHGVQKLLNLPGTTAMIGQTMIPYPSIMAIVIGAAEVAIAIALVFGLMTRIAGLGVLLIAGGALAFVLWGSWNPFVPGESGFTGELELLLAAVGVLLLFTGGGGWAVDRGFRARRAAEREAREV